MRRENRMQADNNGKTIFYLVGSIVAVITLLFITIFVLNGGSNKDNSSQFSTAKINNLVPNDTRSVTGDTEQASSQIGKSINEVKNTISNSISNTVASKTAQNTITTSTNTVTNTSSEKNKSDKITVNEVKENVTVVENKEESKAQKPAKTNENKEEKNPVFVRPVEGEIIKEYAKQKLVYSETLKEWITHPGIDIKAEKTSVVKAAADGRVSSIKNDPRYGLTVVIEHQNGFKTVYSNLLTAEFVTEGEEIESGQTIGTVGNSATFEILDDTHLHFEILKDNENVDPNIYMQ